METEYQRAAERLNSVYNLSDASDPLRRASGRLYYLLAKTYWREDPKELERTLSYELTGRAYSDLAKKLLGGQEPWTEEEMATICSKYRVKPSYFSIDREATKAPVSTQQRTGSATKIAKVSVFGALTKNSVQDEPGSGWQTYADSRTRAA